MLNEDKKLRSQPRNPEDPDTLEYAILPLIFWSDATHLSSFGSASLWPIYLYFANVSKYHRGRPTEFMAQHLAYIPSVRLLILKYARVTYSHRNSSQMHYKRPTLSSLESPLRPTSSSFASANFSNKFGSHYSTTTSCMHMSMGLCSCVATASSGEFSLVFLHILLIIPRSVYISYVHQQIHLLTILTGFSRLR